MEKHPIKTIMIIMVLIGEAEYRMHDNFVGGYREEALFA